MNSLVLLISIFFLGCTTANFSVGDKINDQRRPEPKTHVEVVELSDYRFKADSFFEERRDLSFQEKLANQVYVDWATEAIEKVNTLLPDEDQALLSTHDRA